MRLTRSDWTHFWVQARLTFHCHPPTHLYDRVPDCVKQVLVHLSRQRVIHEHIRTLPIRAKGPQASYRQQIPFVLRREEVLRRERVNCGRHSEKVIGKGGVRAQ